ncbi:hypothetical protein MTR67_013906 [Solanum verrucosum]|uniref:DUF4216 domain-containing protein n=1 Tax=Solanum verrucosum TaxID=315347 RepID=A0AAF0QC34_SOLVR|nr:hypothetical protein MTR67_013906 [Solanum verrucosum]
MHIEKNICDSLLGTLLDILGKSKDHINSRYDLHEIGIHKELQPVKDCDTGNIHLAKVCFSMKPEEKRLFCTVLKDAKLPKGFASNISSRVQIEDMKVSGYKSHDAHFILHYLIRVAVRKVLPKNVSLILIRYQTEDDEDIQTGEGDASPLFPKTGHPIGSMNKRIGKTFNMEHNEWFEAHRYALFNTGDEKVETFIKEHNNLIDNRTRGNAWVKAQIHSKDFSDWFRDKVKNIEVSNHLRWLAKGPNFVAKRYTGYFINGYRFHTKTRDVPCKTQNSGVTLSATTDNFASARDQNLIDGMVIYYGIIQDIIEIDYWGCFSVVLFRRDWFHNEVDEYGLTRVYINKKCSTNDPFVLASQVHQIFYVEDPIEKNVYYARHKVSVDLYDLEEENCPNIEETFWRETNDNIGSSERVLDVDVRWSREDLSVDIIDLPALAQHSEDVTMQTSEEEDDFDDTDWDWMEADD